MDTASMPAESAAPKRNSSNLYLVTFLATLFLLLFVSCAIVLRSYLLRRRYQQQLDHALAHGIILTPRAPGSRKRRFGVRPRMYESWIAPLHVSGVSGSQLGKAGGGRWSNMLPLTVQTVIVKRRSKDPNAQLTSPTFSIPSTAHSPTVPPVQDRFSALTVGDDNEGRTQPPAASIFGIVGSRPVEFPAHVTEEEVVTRERMRERRESDNWRTFVSPSPNLAAASVPPLVSATSASSRRLSMPAASSQPADDNAQRRSTSASPLGSLWRRPPLRQDVSSRSQAIERAHRFERGIREAWGLRPPDTRNGANDNSDAEVGASTKFRVRTEMLQISVLVAMPDVRMSTLYGDAGVVKRLKAAELGGWGYRGPAVKGPSNEQPRDSSAQVGGDDGRRRRRKKREEERVRKENDDDDEEVVEVPGDDLSVSSSEDDDEEQEEEDNVPLPGLVLGVTRLNYRHARDGTEERPPPTFVIPSNPPPPPPPPSAPIPAPIPVPVAVYDSNLQPQAPSGSRTQHPPRPVLTVIPPAANPPGEEGTMTATTITATPGYDTEEYSATNSSFLPHFLPPSLVPSASERNPSLPVLSSPNH